jgi:hypothetical protein
MPHQRHAIVPIEDKGTDAKGAGLANAPIQARRPADESMVQ